MKYVLAVSGGVDSVVLLDLLVKYLDGIADGVNTPQLILAHFDHGMRQDSGADARFVEGLAKKYGLKFVVRHSELKGANELVAREARYDFLFQVAEEFGTKVVTAHHKNDVIETVALNIGRGTRWRGLSGMSDPRILRPLAGFSKQEIYEYATKNRLEWVEDETNLTDMYQRNKLRQKINSRLSAGQQNEIYELWKSQKILTNKIRTEIEQLTNGELNRYFLTNIDWSLAEEIVQEIVRRKFGVSLLSHQLERAVLAIRAGRAGTSWQIGGGLVMKLTSKSATIIRGTWN